jgi:hypothetical protein
MCKAATSGRGSLGEIANTATTAVAGLFGETYNINSGESVA